MNENKLHTAIVSIGDLLQYSNLWIPEYQRPYKWTIKNVNQLIDDIYTFKDKGAYRIGTIVIHNDGEKLNIVDGQQRTITFLLITRAIIQSKKEKIRNTDLIRQIELIESRLFIPSFTNDTTFANIYNNYKEIERRIASIDEDFIYFFFNKCEVTQFILVDISEAFQFFDSQNSRGKDLEPHDLLKAFHLRAFSENEELQQSEVVDHWEKMASNDLTVLFSEFLFKVRSWCRGNSARYFTKDDVELFKGVNLSRENNYPFIDILKYSDEYVYMQQEVKFPFQLDLTIVNGKRFFEMISHYNQLYINFQKKADSMGENSQLIFQTINHYQGKDRIGDKYVRVLFNCVLLYYQDKFGNASMDRIIQKLFIWAYTLRLTYQNLQLASVDNYVLGNNYFKKIKDAYDPKDILKSHLPILTKDKIIATKVEEIESLFISMKYYGG